MGFERRFPEKVVQEETIKQLQDKIDVLPVGDPEAERMKQEKADLQNKIYNS